AGAGAEGRDDRGGADGRPERVDPDAPAGALPADVWRLRRRDDREFADLHQRSGSGRPARALIGAEPAPGTGREYAHARQDHHDPQRALAEDRGRSRALRSACRRRAADLRAGDGAGDGATLFSVLSRRTAMSGDAALYRLLTWLSPAYPLGAYAYSHGLEH